MADEKQLNPMAMSAAEAAKTLRVPPGWIEEDLQAGAPANADLDIWNRKLAAADVCG